MMQFPTALANCGVEMDMQTMLTEAIQTLGNVSIRVSLPRGDFEASETDEMARAVEAWTNWNFKGFGYELGKLLRELVMLALPQKYSVDASGRLRRYSQMEATQKTSSPLTFSMAIIGGA